MTEKPADSRGRFRALYDWLTQATPSPDSPTTPSRDRAPARIGRYEILRKLGEGGMGVVYAARDERLARNVALKTMSSLASDESARKRFWREARAAASVSHPNVCQIHEIGEEGTDLFLVMELLEGEPLVEKLKRGPMSLAETGASALEQPAALAAPR